MTFQIKQNNHTLFTSDRPYNTSYIKIYVLKMDL